ncbi:rhomboid family intramembrane serine protease [Halodesulfovibrio marinisediminis]|uniref:Membrane associated serine protease, rhomboid family n=1 Tax=Halodesulfovibrio marinisediminis DSM 17456 TaxID=1121457 RepID=A0A1N6IDL0_9BACT|nr:rhomboid family intramembrane serine protease [Halodesulfovibrio marinisediminis]SIO30118.1 Membrane associated serine protease, rhomboid family [Halodesulfovibrio marinisediminis DSM 17456]
MIPLHDSIPRVHTPYMLYAITTACSLIFVFEMLLPLPQLTEFFYLYGVVPARFTNPEWAARMHFPPDAGYVFLTHLFIHGGWMHILINMWFLWIFGDNIEDVMGPTRFLIFYLVCGAVATGINILFTPTSTIPVVGASGAVAGIMGAYFLLYPHARVLTLIPVIIIPFFFYLPALFFLLLWAGIQIVLGIASLTGHASSSVAWWAHIGGFLCGIILLPFFRKKNRCYYCKIPEGTPPVKPQLMTPKPREFPPPEE